MSRRPTGSPPAAASSQNNSGCSAVILIHATQKNALALSITAPMRWHNWAISVKSGLSGRCSLRNFSSQGRQLLRQGRKALRLIINASGAPDVVSGRQSATAAVSAGSVGVWGRSHQHWISMLLPSNPEIRVSFVFQEKSPAGRWLYAAGLQNHGKPESILLIFLNHLFYMSSEIGYTLGIS